MSDKDKIKELYQTVLDVAFEMIVLIDSSFNIIDINISTIDNLGYKDKSDLFNKHIKTIIGDNHFDTFIEKLNTNHPIPTELIIYNKTKNKIPVLFKSTKVDHLDEIEYMISFMDLRDIKQKERIVQEQSLYASMGFMMDEIAHQWKQPLGTISILSSEIELNLDMDTEITKDDLRECSKNIQLQIEHLTETIDEFRKFFRKTDKKQPHNISKMLYYVVGLLQNRLNKNNVKVNIECDAELMLNIISIEFKHIVINLINNSIDAFIENNIKSRNINIKVIKEKEDILFIFSDNAGGIDNKIIHHIFDFNITTKQKGTGVGLYMVKQIIDKNNAKIEVLNSDCGVDFKIIFKN